MKIPPKRCGRMTQTCAGKGVCIIRVRASARESERGGGGGGGRPTRRDEARAARRVLNPLPAVFRIGVLTNVGEEGTVLVAVTDGDAGEGFGMADPTIMRSFGAEPSVCKPGCTGIEGTVTRSSQHHVRGRPEEKG